jgi:hypothetical protein
MPPRPPISPEKRKERYLEAVRDKMAKLYAYGEAKPPAREQLWHEITGFLEAARGATFADQGQTVLRGFPLSGGVLVQGTPCYRQDRMAPGRAVS